MTQKKAVMSWSSGKDSTFALARARAMGELDVVALVSSSNEEYERVAIHGTRRSIAEAQAEALGLPFIDLPLPNPCTDEIYQERMGGLVKKLRDEGVGDWVFGDLFLADVLAYRKSLFEPYGVMLHTPLWGRDTTALAQDMLAVNLEAYIVTLDPKKLPAELCGARYDEAFLDALPEGVDPCGEYGEFHTVVANGPGFAKGLAFEKGEVVERSGFIYCDFLLAE